MCRSAYKDNRIYGRSFVCFMPASNTVTVRSVKMLLSLDKRAESDLHQIFSSFNDHFSSYRHCIRHQQVFRIRASNPLYIARDHTSSAAQAQQKLTIQRCNFQEARTVTTFSLVMFTSFIFAICIPRQRSIVEPFLQFQ